MPTYTRHTDPHNTYPSPQSDSFESSYCSPQYNHYDSTGMVHNPSSDSNGSSNSGDTSYSGYSQFHKEKYLGLQAPYQLPTSQRAPQRAISSSAYSSAAYSSAAYPSAVYPSDTKPDKTPRPNKKDTQHTCLYAYCGKTFTRAYDLDRHMKIHFPGSVIKLDCPKAAEGSFCGRMGENGFTRRDHMQEHLRKVHVMDIPKSARGTRHRDV